MFDNYYDVEEDDWFFESIKCYKKLQMYDLQIQPKRMIKVDEKSLCLVGKHPATRRTEVMWIELPAKLLLPPEEEGRCKANDFQILSGGFFDNDAKQICNSTSNNEVLVSFENNKGLTLLNLSSDTSNVITESGKLPVATNLVAPHVTLQENNNNLIVTKTTSDPIFCFDLESKKLIRQMSVLEPLGFSSGDIFCRFPSQSFYLINSVTGCVIQLDGRTFDTSSVICKGSRKSNYVFDTNCNEVCVLSSEGECALYDCRYLERLVAYSELNFTTDGRKDPKILMTTKNRISISGIGNSVHIYERNGAGFRHIFTHRGHNQMDSKPEGLITDHMWLPSVSDNFVVSCAENGTLNCWEYRIK